MTRRNETAPSLRLTSHTSWEYFLTDIRAAIKAMWWPEYFCSNSFNREEEEEEKTFRNPYSSQCRYRVWRPIVSFSDHLQLKYNSCYAHLLVWIFCNLKSYLMWWKSRIKTWNRLLTQKRWLLLKGSCQLCACRPLCKKKKVKKRNGKFRMTSKGFFFFFFFWGVNWPFLTPPGIWSLLSDNPE